MARIFGSHEIEDGRIPELDQFERIASIILELPSPDPLVDRPQVMIHGSVAEGRHKIGSDIDALIIFPSAIAYDAILQYLEWIRIVSNAANIKVESIVLRQDWANNGYHSLDSLFLGHLKNSENNKQYVVGRPASSIERRVTGCDLDDMFIYLAAKIEKFTKAVCYSDIDISTMQRALELVRAIERKLLIITGQNILTQSSQIGEYILSKLDTKEKDAISKSIEILLAIDVKIKNALEAALNQEVTDNKDYLSEYQRTIYDLYFPAIKAALVLSMGSISVIEAIKTAPQDIMLPLHTSKDIV